MILTSVLFQWGHHRTLDDSFPLNPMKTELLFRYEDMWWQVSKKTTRNLAKLICEVLCSQAFQHETHTCTHHTETLKTEPRVFRSYICIKLSRLKRQRQIVIGHLAFKEWKRLEVSPSWLGSGKSCKMAIFMMEFLFNVCHTFGHTLCCLLLLSAKLPNGTQT